MTREQLIERAMACIESRLERYLDATEEELGAEFVEGWEPSALVVEFLSDTENN